jgi:uncharacterized protein (TIGR00255 family)
MIRSMTAFAYHEHKDEIGGLNWSLRSLNHRYLEVFLRLPEPFRSLESQLRERAAAILGRGKIECVLSYSPAATHLNQINVNEALANAVVEASHKLEAVMNNPARISALDILQWPGVAIEPEVDTTPLLSSALASFDGALEELLKGREREGARLKELILQRCEAIMVYVAKVRGRRPDVVNAQREKLLTRISEMGIEADPHRLEQELVIVAQKLDVAEELDRMDSHSQELMAVFDREEPVGRRLDFLMQEFNREVNTLGSKSADIETTQAVVELKVLIEQIREQIQNIE